MYQGLLILVFTYIDEFERNKVKLINNDMKLKELKKGVDKGSQSRAHHPNATDDPEKYIGQGEKYDTPQGINSKKKTDESMFTAGWSGNSPHMVALPPELLNPPSKEIKKSRKAPLKKVNKNVKKSNNSSTGVQVIETIRKIPQAKINGEYFVMDGKVDAGKALVSDGVIGEIVINNEIDKKNTGKILHKLLSLITREADFAGANLVTQLDDISDRETKAQFEQFGFRHTKDGIMKRVNNSARPPYSYR